MNRIKSYLMVLALLFSMSVVPFGLFASEPSSSKGSLVADKGDRHRGGGWNKGSRGGWDRSSRAGWNKGWNRGWSGGGVYYSTPRYYRGYNYYPYYYNSGYYYPNYYNSAYYSPYYNSYPDSGTTIYFGW